MQVNTDDVEAVTRPPSAQMQAPEGRDRALADLEHIVASLGTAQPSTDSRVPLGRQAHRTVSRLVARDLAVVRVELRDAVSALGNAVLSIDARLSALDAPLGDLDARLSALHAPLGDLDARLSALDARLSALDAPLGDLDARLSALHALLSDLDARLSALDARLSALEAHAPGFVDPSVAARVVRALYLAILEREPDPEGLAYHSRRLAAGLPLERQVAEFAQARDGDRRHAPSGTGASDKEWARLRDLQLAQQRTLRAVTHRLALIEDRLLGAQQGGGAADPSQR
jgi:septal ring factor EnvC (AmiA/AmiB activator)